MTNYYGVSVAVWLRVVSGDLPGIWVWENLYLVRAKSASAARRVGRQIGRQEAPTGRKSMRPFTFKRVEIVPQFAGVIRCCQAEDTWDTQLQGSIDRIEVSFMTLSFAARSEFKKYLEGRASRAVIHQNEVYSPSR